MKDKRQRMAFAWPYGDPQVLAYMLSAVAASGYNSNGNVPIQNSEYLLKTNGFNNDTSQHHQTNISFQSESQRPEASLSQLKANETVNYNPIMNEMQMPLHLNIKTPSPNSTNLSESTPFSSSSSLSSAHYVQSINGNQTQNQNSTPFHTFSQNLNSTMNTKIPPESISPISLFIPNSKPYSNYDSQLNLLLKPNQAINQSKPIMTTPSSLSFKSPAFGLADSSPNANSDIGQFNNNSNLLHTRLEAPLDSGYSSFIQSAQRSC